MRKTTPDSFLIKYILFLPVIMLAWTACKKDLGNYDYHAINELSFTGLDTVNGYSVYLGDTLRMEPGVIGSINKVNPDYTYEWKIDGNATALSTDENFAEPVSLPPGEYIITLRVKDNDTEVEWLKQVKVTVLTPYYEGYLVLSDVNGASRLDFLSYVDGAFVHHEDVLKKLNVDIPEQGKPYQVFYNYSSWTGDYIYLATETATSRLDPETFAYKPEYDIRYQFVDDVPAGFKVEKLIMNRGLGASNYIYLYNDGNLYTRSRNFFQYQLQMNVYVENKQAFRAAPWEASNSYTNYLVVLYDETNKRFVTQLNGQDGCRTILPSLNFPEGYELLFMTDNNVSESSGNAYGYAVLKDGTSGEIRIIRFGFINNSELTAVNYNEVITGTGIAQAEQFAISPNLGYLFYNVGGKVYEYDLFTKTSKLMIDKGAQQITQLSFDLNARPEWRNWLVVSAYDPGGEAGKNGSLALYSVAPVNGNLVEQFKWNDLGKVVSSSYRYR